MFIATYKFMEHKVNINYEDIMSKPLLWLLLAKYNDHLDG